MIRYKHYKTGMYADKEGDFVKYDDVKDMVLKERLAEIVAVTFHAFAMDKTNDALEYLELLIGDRYEN